MSLSRESSPMDQLIGWYVLSKLSCQALSITKKKKVSKSQKIFFLSYVLDSSSIWTCRIMNYKFWIFVLIFLTAAPACRKQQQMFKIQNSTCPSRLLAIYQEHLYRSTYGLGFSKNKQPEATTIKSWWTNSCVAYKT